MLKAFHKISHPMLLCILSGLFVLLMAGCADQPAEAPDAPSSEPMEYQIPQLEADPAAYGSKLTAYDMAAFDVLLGGAAGNNTEAQDALRLCPGIITTLRYGQEQEWTAELLQPIHDLMAYFEANGRLPREPYDAEITEYATSMDAPLLGVAAQLAYERTGEEPVCRLRAGTDSLYCLFHGRRRFCPEAGR